MGKIIQDPFGRKNKIIFEPKSLVLPVGLTTRLTSVSISYEHSSKMHHWVTTWFSHILDPKNHEYHQHLFNRCANLFDGFSICFWLDSLGTALVAYPEVDYLQRCETFDGQLYNIKNSGIWVSLLSLESNRLIPIAHITTVTARSSSWQLVIFPSFQNTWVRSNTSQHLCLKASNPKVNHLYGIEVTYVDNTDISPQAGIKSRNIELLCKKISIVAHYVEQYFDKLYGITKSDEQSAEAAASVSLLG